MLFYGSTCIILIAINVADQTGITECLNKEPSFRYQAFNEESFFIQCTLPSQNAMYIFNDNEVHEHTVKWFYQKGYGKLNEIKNLQYSTIKKKGNALWFSPVVTLYSGNYICKTEQICLKIILDVKEKDNCLEYGQSSLFFLANTKNIISCPSLHCHPGLRRSNITWYKDGNELTEFCDRKSLKLENESIQLYQTYDKDSGRYMCDYGLYINERQWVIRAMVDVVIGVRNTQQRPIILYPDNGTIIEAELDKPLELKCNVQFGFERNFKPLIKWEKIYPDSKEADLGQTDLRKPEKHVLGTKYILTSTLDVVTLKELNATFRCWAQNSVGTSTTEIKLVRKTKDVVFLIYILCLSVLLLVITALGSAMVYLYWIEIVLFYRNYLSKDETIGDAKKRKMHPIAFNLDMEAPNSDNKKYDAFISYAKQSFAEGEESFEDSFEEERFAAECLPSVLEDKYNYKLCLLERDTLPGGVYVDEIVKIIKRSRRVIFILSPRYFTGPSLFELHAAVTCLMEEEPLKLILIKFKPFREPESLPPVVKKALNALPIITWKRKPSLSSSMNTKFWNRIRYHMPVKRA